MIKVKARIMTDVEMIIDSTMEDPDRETKRKIYEHLAKEGYVNSDIRYLTTERIEEIDIEDLDFDLSDDACYMYGDIR